MNFLKNPKSGETSNYASDKMSYIPNTIQQLSLLLLALVSIITPLHADDFEDGLAAYDESKFLESAAAFERSLEHGESAAARHNLALSLYQIDKPAEAIWQLERAIRLAPIKDSYLFKLGALRQQLGLHQQPTNWWQSAANILPQHTWIWISTACFWLAAMAIILPKINGSRHPIMLKLIISFSIIVLILSSTALVIRHNQQATGVIISNEPISLNYAPASAAPEAGIARPGERARVLDQHNQFLKIETEADITGWVHTEAFRKL